MRSFRQFWKFWPFRHVRILLVSVIVLTLGLAGAALLHAGGRSAQPPSQY